MNLINTHTHRKHMIHDNANVMKIYSRNNKDYEWNVLWNLQKCIHEFFCENNFFIEFFLS